MSRLERKEQSRRTIVRSAAEMLRTRGIAATGVSAVMAKAGLTVGGFYAHFESREHLLNEALTLSATQMFERASAAGSRHRGVARVLAVSNAYLSETHLADVEGGCALPSLVPALAHGDLQSPVQLEGIITQFADKLAAALGQGKKARLRALGCIALMFGGLSLARSLRGTPLASEVLKASRLLIKDALSNLPQRSSTAPGEPLVDKEELAHA